MTISPAVKIVKTIIDLMGKGDLNGALAFISDDFLCEEAASLPYGGTYRGKPGFAQLMKLLANTWEDFDVQRHNIFGEGEDVVLIQTMTGQINGKRFSMPLLEQLKVRDGLVTLVVPCYHDPGALGKLYASQKSG